MQPGCHGNIGVNLIRADSVEMDNFASMNKHSPVFLCKCSCRYPCLALCFGMSGSAPDYLLIQQRISKEGDQA